MTPLERRYRLLLRAYPPWYRRDRAGEILGTFLEASPPGRRWPSFHDAWALVIGGLRARGWVWCLSVLWVGIGAAGSGYVFFVTTKPDYNGSASFDPVRIWGSEPAVIAIAAHLAVLAWLALPFLVLPAGFARLTRPGGCGWFRAAAWVAAWAAGFRLMYLALIWGDYPARDLTYTCGPGGDCGLNLYSPAVVSWGELAICAAWLALGAAMILILNRPASGWDMADASRRSRGQASL